MIGIIPMSAFERDPEELLKMFLKSCENQEKTNAKQASEKIGKEEFFSDFVTNGPFALFLKIPKEFGVYWARKQDWPLTNAEAVMYVADWLRQLIKWKKG